MHRGKGRDDDHADVWQGGEKVGKVLPHVAVHPKHDSILVILVILWGRGASEVSREEVHAEPYMQIPLQTPNATARAECHRTCRMPPHAPNATARAECHRTCRMPLHAPNATVTFQGLPYPVPPLWAERCRAFVRASRAAAAAWSVASARVASP